MVSTNQLLKPLRQPRMWVSVEYPSRPDDIAKRHFNRIVKDVLRKQIEFHHKRVIPAHFRVDARSRYNYKPRSAKYNAIKLRRYGSRRDLVKTGATERRMKTERKIVIGGAAEGGKKHLDGTLILQFAFTKTAAFQRSQVKRFTRTTPKTNSRGEGNISIADMKREIQAITRDEQRGFAERFKRDWLDEYHKWQGRRIRTRRPTN